MSRFFRNTPDLARRPAVRPYAGAVGPGTLGERFDAALYNPHGSYDAVHVLTDGNRRVAFKVKGDRVWVEGLRGPVGRDEARRVWKAMVGAGWRKS